MAILTCGVTPNYVGLLGTVLGPNGLSYMPEVDKRPAKWPRPAHLASLGRQIVDPEVSTCGWAGVYRGYANQPKTPSKEPPICKEIQRVPKIRQNAIVDMQRVHEYPEMQS